MPSIFSRILAGQIPAQMIHRDCHWAVLLDIAPVSPGHLLLVPVQEAQLLHQLDADTLAGLGPLTARASAALRRASGCDAVSIILRDGAAAGQEVPHVHVHLIARRQGERRAHDFRGRRGSAAELDAWASRMRAAWA
jgi:histidine triad (HIT) family protein